ncbi:MAG: glycoside hydrolase, partial [Armatimonadota bacterium]|nr:glycoside hydrolase [Armatimonadota bacterium]
MRAINELGYLTSEYDNYTDILPTQDGTITNNRARLPDDAVLMANNERMKAWLTFDGKTQYMKRCPALWVDAAKQYGDRVLKEWPFLGRFIDVTTAEGLYECYDPNHPLTRGEKRACGPQLINSFRQRGLVMGGEHGIWWAVPVLDYIEGMMSGGYASWPAGHLIHPKSKDEEFTYPGGGKTGKWEAYAQWGIGHQWRAPLWELVFHDCIVSTWYWGDASDWLLDAAPEVTPKKDAFNILYGTIPLLWANAGGSWQKDRAVFLRTYRNTCKLHEAIATAALLTHEFLTPDHAVQRTRFSDGTTCVVNFGEKPAPVTVGGKRYLLPQNGWAVHGPKVRQSLALEEGTPVTTIHAPGYAFSDRGGVPLTARLEAPGRLRVVVDGRCADVNLQPGELSSSWSASAAV